MNDTINNIQMMKCYITMSSQCKHDLYYNLFYLYLKNIKHHN